MKLLGCFKKSQFANLNLNLLKSNLMPFISPHSDALVRFFKYGHQLPMFEPRQKFFLR